MFNAYGLRFTHPDRGGIGEPPLSWPTVDVRLVPERPFPHDADLVLDDGCAAMRFREGWLEVERRGADVVLTCSAPGLTPEAFVHPYFSVPAAAVNHWLGHVSLHAAAVQFGDSVVVVTAPKEGGKSTTVAAAAAAGLPVLTDDLLVIRGSTAMAGPRSIDLREEAAAELGGRSLGLIGGRTRWRLDLPPIRPELPIAGVVELAWGDELARRPLSAADRIDVLAACAALGPQATSAERLLDVAALPMTRLERPRGLEHLPAVIDELRSLAA